MDARTLLCEEIPLGLKKPAMPHMRVFPIEVWSGKSFAECVPYMSTKAGAPAYLA
jgi:hypothetical protein